MSRPLLVLFAIGVAILTAGCGGLLGPPEPPPSVKDLLVQVEKQAAERAKLGPDASALQVMLTVGASGVPTALDKVKAENDEEAAVSALAQAYRQKSDSDDAEARWYCIVVIEAIQDLGLANDEALALLEQAGQHSSEPVREAAQQAREKLTAQGEE